MFEKVSGSLKYDSNIFFVHNKDHFTPLALRVRGNKTINAVAIIVCFVIINTNNWKKTYRSCKALWQIINVSPVFPMGIFYAFYTLR